MKYRIEYGYVQPNIECPILFHSKKEFDVQGDQEAKIYFKEFLRVAGLLARDCKLLRIDQEEKTTHII